MILTILEHAKCSLVLKVVGSFAGGHAAIPGRLQERGHGIQARHS